MKANGLVILSGLVILVGGYALYDYQSEQKSQKTKTEQSALVSLNKDQISEIEIQNDKKIHLKRDVDGWTITEPIQDLADNATVEEFIEGSTKEKSVDTVKSGQGIDWALYGLDKPFAVITYVTNSGQKAKIAVSGKKNYAGETYLRRGEEDQVLTGGTMWVTRAERRSFDFRDKRLMRKPAAQVEALTFEKGQDSFSIQKSDTGWFSPERKKWDIDSAKVQEVLSQLNTTAATQIFDQGFGQDLAVLAKQKPILGLKAQLKEKRVFQADFFEIPKKGFYAKLSAEPKFIQLAGPDADKFISLKVDSFRDKRKAFDYPKDLVQKVEIQSAEGNVIKPSNEESVKNLLSQLRNMEISEFQSESGSVPGPKTDVILRGAEDKVIFQLTVQKKEKGKSLAKTNLFHELFWLEERAVQKLNLGSYFESKDKPKGSGDQK